MYKTASPLKGAVNDRDEEPPVTDGAEVVTPVAGLNHSTLRVRFVLDRFTVNEPLEAA